MSGTSDRPIAVYVGSDPRMGKAEAVLEFTIREYASRDVEIVWMRAGDPGWRAGEDWNIGPRAPGKPYSGVGWATDFSSFRWAVPALARAAGHRRAIYLDVDMAVFANIAELADWHLAACPLAHPGRTDVIVFDAEHAHWISNAWPGLDEIKASGNTPPFYQARAKPAAMLPREWDEIGRYDADRTKLYHWTDMRRQPWKPWPEAFAYDREHPESGLWHSIYARATGGE